MTLTHLAKQHIRASFEIMKTEARHMVAVDATCGNGHDTLFLLELGFSQVFAFDIQIQAIEATRKRCHAFASPKLNLLHASHEDVLEKVNTPIHCAMFNLGYLPSSDQSIITKAKSTLEALAKILSRLDRCAIISILCYRGHTGGAEEHTAVHTFLDKLNESKQFTISRYDSTVETAVSPILYIIKTNELAAKNRLLD